MKDLDTVTQDALQLTLNERASLAERLLESLDGLSEAEIEELWAEEAIRRVDSYRAGRIDTYPAEEVHQQILARLT